ncbi:VOC family protein [Nocardia sp. NPDC051570]|uniref:VOC family protein n=1 Tax=Nocardia sp. NPDC051570 TaxID=3364324 RepID=UPI0037B38A86
MSRRTAAIRLIRCVESADLGPLIFRACRTVTSKLRGGAEVPNMMFVRVPDPKSGKNRLHFDICPIDSDQETELNRLQALGAARVDVGQGDGRAWVVLADPEGNEFCLSRSLAPGQFGLYRG